MGTKRYRNLIRPFNRICLEGGNLLAGKKNDVNFIIVPESIIYENRNLYPGAPNNDLKIKLTDELGFIFSAEVIWIDDSAFVNKKDGYQSCLFHLDLYITLCGETDQGKQLVLIADVDGSGKDVLSPNALSRLKNGLDKIASDFQQMDFEVGRVPLPYQQELNNNTTKNVITKVFSYNNCLVENYDGHRRIYIPGYNDIPNGGARYMELPVYEMPFERGATEQLIGMINPTPLPDFTIIEKNLKKYLARKGYFKEENIKIINSSFLLDVSMHHGSLHCLTKVLKRTHLV
jgi:hypothetical protein